jgi:anti-anti-sigma factor
MHDRPLFPGTPDRGAHHPAAGLGTAVSLLDVRVASGELGPVILLSGEADLTTVAQLSDALNAQITAETTILTVDMSRLRFADSASVAALARAARTLDNQGGRLELRCPQPGVARTLSLLGLDHFLHVRGEPDAGTSRADTSGT